MDIIDKIDKMLGEEGEVVGPGTTTQDVAKIPTGTKKMKKKKYVDGEAQAEVENKKQINRR